MILYIENLKDTSKKPLKLLKNSVKLQDTELTYRNLLNFHTLTENYQKEKLRKHYYLQSHQREQIPRNKPNQGGERHVLGNL